MEVCMKRTLFTVVLAFLLVVASAGASTWVDTAGKVAKSTAEVTIFENGAIEGYCTAFSINDAKDYFLTADHCYGEYMTVDGMNAYAIWGDPDADLMLLVVPDSGEGRYPALTLAKEMPKQGQPAAALGYGFGTIGTTFMAGYVVQPDTIIPIQPFNGEQHYTITNITIPGMSGGPVFNDNGEIISIVQMGNSQIGIGRTLNELRKLTEKFWENK
jgi:S1-C subfamily serine protease